MVPEPKMGLRGGGVIGDWYALPDSYLDLSHHISDETSPSIDAIVCFECCKGCCECCC